MNTKPRRRLVLIIAVATFGMLGLAVVYVSPKDAFFRPRTFVPEEWSRGDFGLRGEMARDLIASRVLNGKTHAEVEALLGPPDRTRTNELIYTVDIGYLLVRSPWKYTVCISFDEAQNVVRNAQLKD
jgi:hypothetical protein